MSTLKFKQGLGSIVGGFVNVEYGDKINSIIIPLGRDTSNSFGLGVPEGRLVTCAYWIVDENFDIDNMKLQAVDKNIKWCTSFSPTIVYNSDIGLNANTVKGVNGISYVDTSVLTANSCTYFKFEFEESPSINSNKIFVALISTPEGNDPSIYDINDRSLTVGVITGSGSYYYRKSGGINDATSLQEVNNISLDIELKVTPASDGDSSSTMTKPEQIKCDEISYRTWSQQYADNNENDIIDGWNDGGEEPDENYVNNRFNNEYTIIQGRLQDVTFKNPHLSGYSDGNVILPRWVFKRSQIKFIIPKSKGKCNIKLRYKIEAPIHNSAYTNKYFTKIYDNSSDITIIICPRDEGINDNNEFRVILDRCFVNDSGNEISSYSEPMTYYFHTYQKPIANIAYPKPLRYYDGENSYSKFTKIPANNMYSNFKGENAIVNKYVCDALNLLVATSPQDSSGIPSFVRFHISEYKYGRNGCLNTDGTEFDTSNFNTTLDLFKSSKSDDYTPVSEILNGDANNSDKYYRTAYMTGINNCDGSPILLSGRLNNSSIEDLVYSQPLNLWVYREWDYVINSANDIKVGNAWPITKLETYNNGDLVRYYDNEYKNEIPYKSDDYDAGKGYTKEILLTDKIVGDHAGCPMPDLNSTESNKYIQDQSKILLFRAGYVYLIRIRIFHGAAAGAIPKYVNNNDIKAQTIYGIGGDYIYDNTPTSNYPGVYPGINSDIYPGTDNLHYRDCLQEVTLPNGETILKYKKYYSGWLGPDDGTTGMGCNAENVDHTYPGFSEVDYTLFEPVCTTTSKSNIVTVHPTSPQIGVNQWLTFNYRHLSKNIGDIETYAKDPSSQLLQSDSFGKTNGGVYNTVSRIMAMYTHCTETILEHAFANGYRYKAYEHLLRNKRSTYVSGTVSCNYENITLYIKPINNMSYNNKYLFIESMGRKQQNLDGVQCNLNVPIINNFPINGKAMNGDNGLYSLDFYTHHSGQDSSNNPYSYKGYNSNGTEIDIAADTGCYAFNKYRKKIKTNPNAIYTYKYVDGRNDNHIADTWSEYQIIFLSPINKTPGATTVLEEPLGNTYRWQPVINAVTFEDHNIKEIQIENQKNIEALEYPTDNTVRNTSLSNSTKLSEVKIYKDDVQTKYFYEDKYPTISDIEPDMGNYSATNRFTINEFAGETVSMESRSSSGGNVMYTTSATDEYNTNKYFTIRTNATDAHLESYGRLFNRVPVIQDVENGNCINSFGIEAKVNNAQQNIDIYANENDVFTTKNPLVRTTHYLYFKTWINTTFVLKSDVSLSFDYTEEVGPDAEGNYETVTRSDTYSNSSLYYDNAKFINSNSIDAPTIKFGTTNFNTSYGLSEVYGEDNGGWGRCLTADDASLRKIKADGTLEENTSGGIELPIMVRYTPLLQPKIHTEVYTSNGNVIKNIHSSSKTATITYYREHKQSSEGECNENLCVQPIESWTDVTPVVTFTDSNGGSSASDLTELKSYDIRIYYPWIAEDNTYHTVKPNGGINIHTQYDGYYIDADTDPTKSIDTRVDSTEDCNLDMLGGYGICTAYNVLLVPSDIEADDETTNNDINYNKNTNGHFNFFKQIPNYFDCNFSNDSTIDLLSKRSKSILNAGPILVAYLLGPDEINSLSYIDNDAYLPSNWDDESIKGRCCTTLKLDFKKLLDGEVRVNSENEKPKYTSLDSLARLSSYKYDFNDNKLKAGLSYDLVIVPVYYNQSDININANESNNSTGEPYKYDYKCDSNAGSINGITYGSGVDSDTGKIVALAGSNPLVLYNYLQIANIVEGNGSIKNTDDDKPSYVTDYTSDIKECSNCNINASDHAIVFPNVDNELYNIETGKIKEGPGFWLNNSFKLILRMPSFRTNESRYGTSDLNTIEHMSNGMLNSENGHTADDFLFEDIQIHIGKIEELSQYGYPYEMDTNLNTLTAKEDLEKAHIISYKHYWDKGVFSKRLKDYDTNDKNSKDLLTAGALTPDDGNYPHRFIEVNLSNTDLFKNGLVSSNPEGYYIQFRWKSAYCTSDSTQWSDWHGGSFDGGQKWWGDKGLSYFVPVRNYSDVHTEFRNYIKESYPGSLINAKINDKDKDKIVDDGEFISATIGEGSYVSNKDIDYKNGYYHKGVGNSEDAKIVPDISDCSTTVKNFKHNTIPMKNADINTTINHDNPYYDEISYRVTHDTKFNIPENVSNLHQQMWEMLYVDYIVRNMCKLYYKPNHNDVTTEKISGYSSSVKNCNLAVPYHKGTKESIKLNYHCVGWDNIIYSTTASNKKLVSQSGPNKAETTSGGQRWNRNKYYRKMITKDDFDKLNSHLKELIEFTRHEELAGKESKTPIYGNIDVLLRDENFINFDRLSRLLIGNTTDTTSGHSEKNNINFKMMGSNYIQNIWQNILSICKPGSRVTYKNTKTGR